MGLYVLTILVLILGCVCTAPTNEAIEADKAATVVLEELNQEKDDLKTDASTSHGRRYSDWGSGYQGSYNGYGGGVTGYGLLDDKYNSYYGSNYGGYDNTNGYNGYSGWYPAYGGSTGYSGQGYGYNKGYDAYGANGYIGNGGYGGQGGNGGLNSYYGYNNPYYHGAYHLGYGYYNKRPGYGNIYNGGITPSLVTGYRGYSR